MPKAVEDALFHVAMEALNNTLKHANATKIIIRLDVLQDHLVLHLADDGVGFRVSERTSSGMGLTNMREWMARVGGRLEIRSNGKGGTKIWARIPVELLADRWP